MSLQPRYVKTYPFCWSAELLLLLLLRMAFCRAVCSTTFFKKTATTIPAPAIVTPATTVFPALHRGRKYASGVGVKGFMGREGQLTIRPARRWKEEVPGKFSTSFASLAAKRALGPTLQGLC